MLRSETIGELAKALAKAQGQMANAKKDSQNPYFKSVYADLSSIVDAIKAPLSDNGIAYVQTTDTDDGTVIVETTLLHASGEWLASHLRMKPTKDDPQGIGSALTYARRYGLQAIVGLAADDDDGNAASGTGEPKQARPAPPRANPEPKPPAAQPAAPTSQPSPASEAQIKAIYQIAGMESHKTKDETEQACLRIFGVYPGQLSKVEATNFIDRLKAGTVWPKDTPVQAAPEPTPEPAKGDIPESFPSIGAFNAWGYRAFKLSPTVLWQEVANLTDSKVKAASDITDLSELHSLARMLIGALPSAEQAAQ